MSKNKRLKLNLLKLIKTRKQAHHLLNKTQERKLKLRKKSMLFQHLQMKNKFRKRLMLPFSVLYKQSNWQVNKSFNNKCRRQRSNLKLKQKKQSSRFSKLKMTLSFILDTTTMTIVVIVANLKRFNLHWVNRSLTTPHSKYRSVFKYVSSRRIFKKQRCRLNLMSKYNKQSKIRKSMLMEEIKNKLINQNHYSKYNKKTSQS